MSRWHLWRLAGFTLVITTALLEIVWVQKLVLKSGWRYNVSTNMHIDDLIIESAMLETILLYTLQDKTLHWN